MKIDTHEREKITSDRDGVRLAVAFLACCHRGPFIYLYFKVMEVYIAGFRYA